MKGVVAAFEGVAGEGAAGVYWALAVKAMSRHFRSVKDGIVGEIQGTRRRMGEKDPLHLHLHHHVAPGTTKGDTPRLKIIDQALRQHRAFQQISIMESHPWRPQRGLPERSLSLLRAWLFEHFLHPYHSISISLLHSILTNIIHLFIINIPSSPPTPPAFIIFPLHI